MSLQIWLPLNGDLENKGLADITVTNSGATVNDSGKIGKCYSFNGSNNYLRVDPVLTNDQTFSFACWMKLNSIPSSYYCLLCSRTNTASTGIGIWLKSDKTFYVDVGSRWATSSQEIDAGQWYHIAVTSSTQGRKLYINGVQVANSGITTNPTTVNTSCVLIGAQHSSAAGTADGTYFNGFLNDVRIYDHCLTPKEVKEISKALVLHYKLDNASFGQPNLISDSVYESDPWKSAILETLDLDGKAAKRVSHNTLYTKTSNGTTELFPGMTYEANTQYTISVDWRDDYRTDNKISSMYLRFHHSDDSVTSINSGDLRDKHYWTHRSLTSTAGKTVTKITTTYGNGGSMYIANLKLEKGATDTGYALYGNVSSYDSSGYKNDGTITGTLSTTSDTKRYSKAIYFNGSSYILTPSGSFSWFDFNQCTIALWMKPTTTPSGYSGSFGITHNSTDGYYSKCFSITNGSGKFKINAAKGSGWIFIDTGKNATANEWHHYAITLNDSAVKAYLDGELIYTTTIDWNTAYVASDTRVNVAVDLPGSDETFTGYFSDARIYTTALSDNDILELYNTPASVDRDGNLYAREVVEV